DNNACTTDYCDTNDGSVHNDLIDTNDNNECTIDGCDSSNGVFHNQVSVDDGNACTTDAYDSSTGNISHTTVNTDDGNACTVDGCLSSTGVFHTPGNCGVSLHSNILLEGYYIGGGHMINPLFITGLSTDPTDADLITISVMSPNSPYSLIESQTGVLKVNGD